MKQGQEATSGMLGAESNDALGTRLTAQALGSSAAAGIPLNMPANYPISADMENRVHDQSTTPPLADRLKSDWATFAQKARMAWTAARGGDPYAPDPQMVSGAQQMYRPGRDAASVFVGSGR